MRSWPGPAPNVREAGMKFTETAAEGPRGFQLQARRKGLWETASGRSGRGFGGIVDTETES